MRLCKYDTPRVLCQEGVHDDVRDEGDIACGVALLLVPGGIGFGIAEAVITGVNDLGLAVAVDVLQQRLFVANGSRTT